MQESSPEPKRAAKAGRSKYHHGNLRNELIAAGVGAVGSDGAGALTLRAVARRAGVSHSAVYHHFPDKESLFAAVAEEGYRELSRRMRSAYSRAGDDPSHQIHALARTYARFAADRPVYFRVMGEPEMHRGIPERGGLREAHDEALASLVLAVAQAQAAGLIGGDDPHSVAIGFWTLAHGYSESHRTGRGIFADRAGVRLTKGMLDATLSPLIDRMLRGSAEG